MVIAFTIILNDVTTMAAIIIPMKIPDVKSPLVLKASVKARKDPVTKVTKQNIMSNR